MEFLTEEEYLDILDTLPKENQYLEDSDPNKFGSASTVSEVDYDKDIFPMRDIKTSFNK